MVDRVLPGLEKAHPLAESLIGSTAVGNTAAGMSEMVNVGTTLSEKPPASVVLPVGV